MTERQNEIKRVDNLQKEIEDAFTELIHTRWAGDDTSWRPAIDFYETEKAFLIQADMPGIRFEDIQLKASEKTVTICGKRQSMISINRGYTIMSERSTGKFCRTIHLPAAIDIDKAQVQLKSGVYEIYLPKKF